MHFAVVFHALREPCAVERSIVAWREFAFEGVFECEVAAVLLTENGAYNWAVLLAEGVSGDVVGDCEEDERMELDADRCVGGFARYERV